ncbi:MAG: deoxynucleoside kinase [Prevotella sp.]|nr:deoxynucleoside kinase [Prevotella sp.]
MHIVVSGNIGSGKTTLTRLLAKHYGWQAKLEPVIDNPYLSDYYSDIPRWAFNLEVYFLKERFRQALEIAAVETNVVQDRSIWEGVSVFVENNMRMGNLAWRDYQTVISLFEQMQRQLRLPDLTVYLRADIAHLVAQIGRRGRDYEQGISIDYLQGLNALYDRFVNEIYPGRVLTIDVSGLDFQHNAADLRQILDKVDPLVSGLFPL